MKSKNNINVKIDSMLFVTPEYIELKNTNHQNKKMPEQNNHTSLLNSSDIRDDLNSEKVEFNNKPSKTISHKIKISQNNEEEFEYEEDDEYITVDITDFEDMVALNDVREINASLHLEQYSEKSNESSDGCFYEILKCVCCCGVGLFHRQKTPEELRKELQEKWEKESTILFEI